MASTLTVSNSSSSAIVNDKDAITTLFTNKQGSFEVLRHEGMTDVVFFPFVQATTTAQHTLRLDSFEGEEYEGALLFVTLSVNNFAYQSIEEVDPVDWWALLGSAGGVWGKSGRVSYTATASSSHFHAVNPIMSVRLPSSCIMLSEAIPSVRG